MQNNKENILEVKGLKTQFFTESGAVKAVDDVSTVVKCGEVLGLVGESGCGKSVTSLSIMRLISQPGRIVAGEITFNDENLLELPEKRMMDIRGNRISMIFQQPQSSLNPVFRVENQLEEVIILHQDVNRQEARQRVIELLRMVGIPEQEEPPFKDYGKEHFAACWLLETGTKGASKLTLDKISSENISAIGAVKNG